MGAVFSASAPFASLGELTYFGLAYLKGEWLPGWPDLVSRCVCGERAQSHICVRLFVTSWTVAHQASLSMEFSRQEYWSGLPFPTPARLPAPGIGPQSPVLAGRFFTTVPTWEAQSLGP